MLEVGARSKGQASLSTPVEILISVLLAIVDSVGPVKENPKVIMDIGGGAAKNVAPEVLQKISEWNPFFYMIDGFRYGFLGVSDGSLKFGLSYLFILCCLTWYAAYILYKKGYKIKS